MKIDVGSSICKVSNPTAQEQSFLVEYLSFDVAGAWFNPAFKRGHWDGKVRLYKPNMQTFPVGLLRMVKKAAQEAGHTVDVVDKRKVPCVLDTTADLSWLRPYQRTAFNHAVNYGNGILWLATGGGKCLGKGTGVLRYDGTTVPVEQVLPGDKLMGPDSRPRFVEHTNKGYGPLYKIHPVKGTPWVCNDVHVLTLVHTATSEVIDIPLNEYLQKPASWKHLYKLFQPGPVEFGHRAVLPIDPYFLGVWFGDGRRNLSQGIQISKPDAEIYQLCVETAKKYGLEVRVDTYKDCPTYRIVKPAGSTNTLLEKMREVVQDPNNLPKEYLVASLHDRAALLAGLLDTDGYYTHGYWEIVQERAGVAADIAFLARSLGLRVTERIKLVDGKPYARLNIIGDTTFLPIRIARKVPSARKQKKNPLRTGFSVEFIGEGEYYGFTLDNDGRFLLGDFTVTHNTEILAALVAALPCRWLFVVHRKGLMYDAAKRILARTGIECGKIGDGHMELDKRVTVSTFQTLSKALKNKEPSIQNKMKEFMAQQGGMVGDECFPSTTTIDGRSIASFKVGDRISAFDENSETVCKSRVARVFKKKPHSLVRITIGAKTVICTPEHQFWTRHGWQAAYSLCDTEVLLHSNDCEEGRILTWSRVDRVEVLEPGSDRTFGGMCPDGYVYNLEVEKYHTYIADDCIVHNCHTTGAATFWKVAMAAKNAYYRIGLSGTPLARGDKRSIFTVACFGPILWRLRSKTLQEAGFLAKPEIYMVPVEQYSDKHWQQVYKDLVSDSTKRNYIVAKCAMAADKPCMVFVKNVNHGRLLTKLLQRNGVNTGFVWGAKGTLQREEAVKALERADLDVLVASVIFQEGVDIPSLRSVVMAAGGKSAIATLQKIGRGMRLDKDKTTFQVFDILDKGQDNLAKQARERKKTYEAEHFDVRIISEEDLNKMMQEAAI